MRPSDLFSTFDMDKQTDQQTYFPIEIQLYISAVFVGFPDDIHEEKPSFFNLKKRITDRRTDRRTDPLVEMRGRI